MTDEGSDPELPQLEAPVLPLVNASVWVGVAMGG
jgi:hypothetical protein